MYKYAVGRLVHLGQYWVALDCMTVTPIGKWPRAGLRCAPHLPCSEMQHARMGTDRCRVSEWLDPGLRKQLARAQAGQVCPQGTSAHAPHGRGCMHQSGRRRGLRCLVHSRTLPRSAVPPPSPGADARPRASSLCRTVTTPATI